MNRSNYRLPLITGLLGIAACVLRFSLYRLAVDEKGLLIPGHPLSICLLVLTAAAAIFVIAQVIPQQAGKFSRSDKLSGSGLAMAGCSLFAVGMLATVLPNLAFFSVMELLRSVTGLLAVPSLIAVAGYRKRETKPFFGFHALVCIALTLHTIGHYPSWSSRPQLQDSFFPMMGCLLLMLFSYYQTASDVGMSRRRMQLSTGLLATFCCLAAIPNSDTAVLYLTGSIWALTNLWAEPHITNSKEEHQ